MSTVAIAPLNRAVRFYEAPIGKKAVMAVTGVILFGYVIGHLLGNLQIYSSDPDQINRATPRSCTTRRTVPCRYGRCERRCWRPWCCTSWPPLSSGCKTAPRGRLATSRKTMCPLPTRRAPCAGAA